MKSCSLFLEGVAWESVRLAHPSPAKISQLVLLNDSCYAILQRATHVLGVRVSCLSESLSNVNVNDIPIRGLPSDSLELRQTLGFRMFDVRVTEMITPRDIF